MFVGGAKQDFGMGMVNDGHVVFTDAAVVEGPVTNHAGAAITALYDVTFNDAVNGAGGFFGPGNITFNGGFSPGASPAAVAFENGVVFGAANTLAIELGGTTLGAGYDSLQIEGTATLDGTLGVSIINSFTPAAGNTFEVLHAQEGVFGQFDAVNLPALPGGLGWDVIYSEFNVLLAVAPPLAADFDEDGDVDGDDLTKWQGDFGVNADSDADNDGDSDGADFLTWQRQLGSAITAKPSSAAVPEPMSLALVTLGAFVAVTKSYSTRRKIKPGAL